MWAAVVVLNEKLRAVLNRDKSDRYVVSVTIRRERWKVTMVSAYCRFSLEIGGILHSVERVLREEGGKGVVVGADVNAKSPLWGEEETDERGQEVEDMIFGYEMVVLNKSGELKTFEDYNGRGRNLDVTMVTKDMGRLKWSWKVMDEELSDHRMIEFEVREEGQQGRVEQEVREAKWNWRGADWTKMSEMVRRKVAEIRWGDKDVAMMLQNLLMEVCEECVEKVEGRAGGVRWWSRELDEMRLEVRRKRRNWIRYREEQARRLFVVAVAKYKIRIKERKREVWEKDLNEMNVLELFGDAYRLMRRGRRSQVVLSTMKRTDGTWTSGEEETMKYILEMNCFRRTGEKRTRKRKRG